MLNHFVCGNFHQEEDELSCSSPRKAKRKENNRNNNPYSSRGLDKFSTLLADLDERRKKVYSQMNPHDISFVRFAYSNTDDFIPIVVKVKNKDQKKHKGEEHKKIRHLTSFSEPMDQKPLGLVEEEEEEEEKKQLLLPKLESNGNDNKKVVMMLKRPSFYVPVVMILILVLLTVFGRSVATLCTCVVWYVVPLLNEYSLELLPAAPHGKLMKKKDYYVTKMVSTEELHNKNSGKHGHQKSW